jgi:hypothetical protein
MASLPDKSLFNFSDEELQMKETGKTKQKKGVWHEIETFQNSFLNS